MNDINYFPCFDGSTVVANDCYSNNYVMFNFVVFIFYLNK